MLTKTTYYGKITTVVIVLTLNFNLFQKKEGKQMKYVSPKYEHVAYTSEDIMWLSGIFEFTPGGADTDDTTNDVSVSVGVGDLMPKY